VAAQKEQEHQAENRKEEKETSRTSTRKEKSTLDEVLASPMSRQIGRELVRGVFGMLFGSTPRRTTSRRRY
jgi:FixJ family two-component response regulator